MFICNHCPFVKNLKKDIVKLSNFYMKKGLAVVAISSNSVATHPQDGPEFMEEEAKLFKYPFPYLYDEDGRRPFELVYHGQFDDSRPSNNVPITGRDLSLAIDSVLSGQLLSSVQKPSLSRLRFNLQSSERPTLQGSNPHESRPPPHRRPPANHHRSTTGLPPFESLYKTTADPRPPPHRPTIILLPPSDHRNTTVQPSHYHQRFAIPSQICRMGTHTLVPKGSEAEETSFKEIWLP
ncbi:uncharacterized protein LOC130787266 isoform X2 [Actinidia eriantha]|uniref:uncharacterized protein LOC130787266 isoform X2 n=1 Tax=Actinidia eriantha TaxID=165200 RepID=UPI00258D54C9|nr:uncharacterized protein LOC130787266 isoform X2 [Actinidia eriantha]